MRDNNKQAKFKKILIAVCAFVLVIPICCGVITYIYDPFFHYHAPSAKLKYIFDNESYQNAGIARNFEYDTLIVGSSMSRPLRASDINKQYGCNSVQTPCSGGSAKDISIILNQAFDHHKVDRVFYVLDGYMLSGEVERYNENAPKYLYDDNIFNDTPYLISKDLLKIISDDYRNGNYLDYDEMWDDESEFEFSQAAAVGDTPLYTGNVNGYPELSLEGIEPTENTVCIVEKYIETIVKEHQDMEFVFLVPPYPVIYWNVHNQLQGNLPKMICDFKYAYSELSKYSNVEFHFLPLMEETSNLYMYKDSWHYNYSLAKIIPSTLKANTYRIDDNNVDEIMKKFYEYIMGFDYRIYTGEIYQFQKVTQFDEYLNSIDDDRYIKIVLINSIAGELSEDERNELLEHGYLPEDYVSGDCMYVNSGSEIFLEKLDMRVADKLCSASVKYEGVEYCPVTKNVNIVVYDKETNRVVDSAGLRDDIKEWKKY